MENGKPKILDNRTPESSVGLFLKSAIAPGSRLRVVSPYFTIHAHKELRGELEQAGEFKFLFGDPESVDKLDKGARPDSAFKLDESGIIPSEALRMKDAAVACVRWAKRDDVLIRSVIQSGFLHGKMYHIEPENGDARAVSGSSNFTHSGLGFGQFGNLELNTIAEGAVRDGLRGWFDALWQDENRVRNVKKEVLAALKRLTEERSPEFVYFKTLFHIFEGLLGLRADGERILESAHLYDTRIWRELYEFQKHAVKGAINRLLRHNGCIIADSVGLGKTYEALAVIKFFELRNENVLVLCPKRLEDNWNRFRFSMKSPLADDKLRYEVRAHTDLSRDMGDFNWGGFDLVVIDESHNFRNNKSGTRDDTGQIVRRTRYERLLEEVIKSGARTKVLMLSATPVNTSLTDLRNQIYLMTEGRDGIFRESLGIRNLKEILGVAQRQFMEWARRGDESKADLLDRLGGEFQHLLDSVTIARSRHHVEEYYKEFIREKGGFPDRAAPRNVYPPTDSAGEMSYDNLHGKISDFSLAIYRPSHYEHGVVYEAPGGGEEFGDQKTREYFLAEMMRVNFMKRLESSVEAFRLTLGRTVEQIDGVLSRIDAFQKAPAKSGEIETHPDALDVEDDDEFVGGGKGRVAMCNLDLRRWSADLRADREILADVLEHAKLVDANRDGKLAELREMLRDKSENPSEYKDGGKNRKTLVFTSFSDTARYLYNQLSGFAQQELGLHIALVVGSGGNQATLGGADFQTILDNFSPNSRERGGNGEEIDILIATDCISEGQNLQDCDQVVNYDIHWNPVRLIQRFGRVDRLGSVSKRVQMVNFWPVENLDRYLNLERRVKARMALADVAATSADNILSTAEKAARKDLEFRAGQLRRLKSETLDIDKMDEGISMSDLTMDEFLAQLQSYLESSRKELERAPLGLRAVVDCAAGGGLSPLAADAIRPGVIFCLRQNNGGKDALEQNRLLPYYLVYVRDDGEVRIPYTRPRQVLGLFCALAQGVVKPDTALCDAFSRETQNGRNMEKYNRLLAVAISSIRETFRRRDAQKLSQPGGKITQEGQRPESVGDFALVSWLIISERTDSNVRED